MKRKAILILSVILFQACSMSVSMTGGSVSPLSKTFSVTDFDNFARIVNPIVAPRFTEKLKEYMEQNTSLDLVGDNGDLNFEGKITGYTSRPVAIANNNDTPEAEQSRFTLTVFVAFTDQQTPKNNFEQSFSFYYDYDASEILENVVENFLDEVIENIINDVYNKAIVNW
jgi:hypothetical protein